MRDIRIIGTGMAVPDREVSCQMLDAMLGLPDGTTLDRTGVRRRYLSEKETAAQLAARACENALRDAGLSWSDIDCIVATSATMDQALPYNAALIHAELGLSQRRTATMDIGASCLSFMAGLDTMSYVVGCGRYRHVMMVSADIATFGANWECLKEGGIFGDGAAAAVIRKAADGEVSRVVHSAMQTVSEGVSHCQIKAGGSRFHPRRVDGSLGSLATFSMNGKGVFKLAAAEMPGFVDRLLEAAQSTMDDIDLVVPHQASQLALDHISKRLKIDPAKMIDIFKDYGNQVGASLPTALHLAIKGQRAARGDKIMLIGTGAGLTLGGMVLVY